MTSFWRDLRHALRFLRLSPGFTLVAVLTLALGIGANTAIFQLIDSIRLRTIPVKNPQELGTIRIADRHWGSGQFSSQYSQLTFPMWEQIRKRQEGFAEIAVWSDQRFNLATGGEVRKAKGIRVSGDFFHVLGVEPILGRASSRFWGGCSVRRMTIWVAASLEQTSVTPSGSETSAATLR